MRRHMNRMGWTAAVLACAGIAGAARGADAGAPTGPVAPPSSANTGADAAAEAAYSVHYLRPMAFESLRGTVRVGPEKKDAAAADGRVMRVVPTGTEGNFRTVPSAPGARDDAPVARIEWAGGATVYAGSPEAAKALAPFADQEIEVEDGVLRLEGQRYYLVSLREVEAEAIEPGESHIELEGTLTADVPASLPAWTGGPQLAQSPLSPGDGLDALPVRVQLAAKQGAKLAVADKDGRKVEVEGTLNAPEAAETREETPGKAGGRIIRMYSRDPVVAVDTLEVDR